jgi:hypothetical protein
MMPPAAIHRVTSTEGTEAMASDDQKEGTDALTSERLRNGGSPELR